MANSDTECDYSHVVLEESNVNDPCVHINLNELPQYDRNHLISWLKYRGDSLKSLTSMKDIRIRVLRYFDHGTDKNLVDPTFDLKWKKAKVKKCNIFVPKLKKLEKLNVVPDILKYELGDIKGMNGWTKDLSNMPIFTAEHINEYYKKVNNVFCRSSTQVKKHFERGEQLLEELYLDIGSILF